jgi:hypothetical protein
MMVKRICQQDLMGAPRAAYDLRGVPYLGEIFVIMSFRGVQVPYHLQDRGTDLA